jgi:hypothetical protein
MVAGVPAAAREWQKLGALRRELDCLLAEASIQHRGPDLKHAVGAPR